MASQLSAMGPLTSGLLISPLLKYALAAGLSGDVLRPGFRKTPRDQRGDCQQNHHIDGERSRTERRIRPVLEIRCRPTENGNGDGVGHSDAHCADPRGEELCEHRR